mmetsp:Transcript_25705/g.52647  ORF Transcript_25705/g.52647 Transcript_25705/m.52647 type:complete len:94 (-) Transcript_25705:13-294(-)
MVAAGFSAPLRIFMYSSKEGAAEIDLRGSSCTKDFGFRVSNIPPAPFSMKVTVGAPLRTFGAKAAAEPKRSAAMGIFMITDFLGGSQDYCSKL